MDNKFEKMRAFVEKEQKKTIRFEGKTITDRKKVERLLNQGHDLEVWQGGKCVKTLYGIRKFSANW